MGRANKQNTRDKNKGSLPQVPKNMKSDVEFSREAADHGDMEALARANAANQRVKQNRNNR